MFRGVQSIPEPQKSTKKSVPFAFWAVFIRKGFSAAFAFVLPRFGNFCLVFLKKRSCKSNHWNFFNCRMLIKQISLGMCLQFKWLASNKTSRNRQLVSDHYWAESGTTALCHKNTSRQKSRFAPLSRFLHLFDRVLRLFCDTVCSPKMHVITCMHARLYPFITQPFLPRRVDI